MSADASSIRRSHTRIERLLAIKSFREAQNLLRKLVASQPSNARSWQLLGISAFSQGDYAAAASAYQKFVRLEPMSPMAHYSLAITFLRLGRQQDAKPLLRRALELKPDMSVAREKLAELDSQIAARQNAPSPVMPLVFAYGDRQEHQGTTPTAAGPGWSTPSVASGSDRPWTAARHAGHTVARLFRALLGLALVACLVLGAFIVLSPRRAPRRQFAPPVETTTSTPEPHSSTNSGAPGVDHSAPLPRPGWSEGKRGGEHPTDVPVGEVRWMVVMTADNQYEAEDKMRRLISLGYSPRMASKSGPLGLHRLAIGPFTTRDAAASLAATLSTNDGLNARVEAAHRVK